MLIQRENLAVHGVDETLRVSFAHQKSKISEDGCDSMETLLLHESVKQDMGRKRPNAIPCLRARGCDWSVCERSRVMGVTARVPPVMA